MPSDRSDADIRRVARQGWRIVHHRLGDEPSDDLSDVTSPSERIAMMRELSEAAWKLAGRTLPTYERRDVPGALFRPGTPRPDDE